MSHYFAKTLSGKGFDGVIVQATGGGNGVEVAAVDPAAYMQGR